MFAVIFYMCGIIFSLNRFPFKELWMSAHRLKFQAFGWIIVMIAAEFSKGYNNAHRETDIEIV
ncbi:MAG TPA: hypothetical protein DDW73_01555 [Rhizobium sp.]|nr:hypothetical protein [Rhizobium sp.]